ncbi:MAG: methyltransferase domain-containing protein [Candidatus Caldarchaeum sp.]|nr:methyltransferase domain-containing protein [Candidatus Caldarchaeum sp.]
MSLGLRLRSLVQNPYRLLSDVGVARGHVFMDVGCGGGFLSIAAARMVGEEGLVYAVDVKNERLESVRNLAIRLGLRNIKTLMTPAEVLDGVPEQSVDRAVLMFSLHHFADIRAALRQIRRRLKPSGLTLIIDPIASRLLGHGTNPQQIIPLLDDAGMQPTYVRKGILLWKTIVKPT